MNRLVPITLAIVTLAMAVWLYPFDCDGAFAVHDPIWYAMGAERSPAASINPHHPLFHVLLIALVFPLRVLGVAGPGHVATRIVAGLGGVWLLLQICALAGRRRVLIGAAFALLVLATRGFVIEVATGENVVPAAAAALFALILASRPEPNLLATGAALVLALLMRQDNLFVVPGVAAALALGLPRAGRVRRIVMLVVGAGVASIAGYVVAWLIATGGDQPIAEWAFGQPGPWSGPKEFDFGRFPRYFRSIVLAMTGQLEPRFDVVHPATGCLYLAGILLSAFMLRGSSSSGKALSFAVVPTLIARAFFHSWYEAENYEWLVLPVALVAALAAALVGGEPATRPVWRLSGIAIVLGLAAWFVIAHGQPTWELRGRQLITSIEEATVDRRQWRFIAIGGRVDAGLELLGIPHKTLVERFDLVASVAEVDAERAIHPAPTTVIIDRFVQSGMPFFMRHRYDEMAFDAWPDGTGRQLLRHRGLVYAMRMAGNAPERRPASRR